MFKLNNRTSEFYQSGKYIIEIIKDNDPDEPMVEMWIGTDRYGLKMSCFGWPLHQPGAKDGHTEWTMDEAVELCLDNADDYKAEFDEWVDDIEE